MRLFGITLAIVLSLGGGVHAAEHEIRMVTNAQDEMAFEPEFLRVSPGDTLRFVAGDPTHNAETIPGMLPDGAEPFRGEVDEGFGVTLKQEGVYGIMCKSHYAVGMVMAVVVGEPVNLAEAMRRPHPLKAKAVFARHLPALGR